MKKKKNLRETKIRQQHILKVLSRLGLVAIVILPSLIFFFGREDIDFEYS